MMIGGQIVDEHKFYIVKIDIGSKQKYIFRSNRLREIIGASKIIKFVSEKLGGEVLKYMQLSDKYFGKKEGSDNLNDGHKLFAAGGNSMYIFSSINSAKRFNEIFSKFVMEKFDGLELLLVIKEFDIYNEKLIDIYDIMEKKLTAKKGKLKNQFKRIGYGLTELCKSTRKPAVKIVYEKQNDEKFYASRESKDKLDFFNVIYEEHNKNKIGRKKGFQVKFEEDFIKKCGLNDDYDIPNEFKFTDKIDEIGGNSDKGGGYIGITCIDGNGMGKKIQSFNKRFDHVYRENIFEGNIKYIKEFNKLTEEITVCYENVFKEIIAELIDNYENYADSIGYEVESVDKQARNIIPLRSIILAGDDITFITNGKLSVDITKKFIQKITSREIAFESEENKEKMTVGAGVAIVKEKHPFFRTVKIAGELEENSKKKLKEIKNKYEIHGTGSYDASIIDWQLDRGNVMGDLSDIRTENSFDPDPEMQDKLAGRPYIIDEIDYKNKKMLNKEYKNNGDKLEYLKSAVNYNFYHFEKILNVISQTSSRSNIKGFFRAMNSSKEDFKLFALKYNLQKTLNFYNNSKFDVYALKQPIYDAIDIMDLYTYVKEGNRDD